LGERSSVTAEKTGARDSRTLFDKLWDDHVIVAEPDAPTVLYIDLHLIHEVTSPQAFTGLESRGLPVRRPELTVATMDHSIPTTGLTIVDPIARVQIETLERNCETHGIELHRLGSDRHGIVHVIGPELGLTRPGMTIVCGDSHTATHGAFGALAFGIGTSEVEHVLATQCLLQRKAETAEGCGARPDCPHRHRRWHRTGLRVPRQRRSSDDHG